jgi:hypothetical protein
MPKIFEYKVIVISKAAGERYIADTLNEAGADGWELVSVIDEISNTSWRTEPSYKYILKRETETEKKYDW